MEIDVGIFCMKEISFLVKLNREVEVKIRNVMGVLVLFIEVEFFKRSVGERGYVFVLSLVRVDLVVEKFEEVFDFVVCFVEVEEIFKRFVKEIEVIKRCVNVFEYIIILCMEVIVKFIK